jgi:hypothetical protein
VASHYRRLAPILSCAAQVVAAILAVVVDIAILAFLPGKGLLVASCAHLAGMSIGLAYMLRRAASARLIDWPLRDIGKIAIAVALLSCVVATFKFEAGASLTLIARCALGAGVYAIAAWLLDVVKLRSLH